MGSYDDDSDAVNDPTRPLPVAMFGYRNGEAWVADDVFVTRSCEGDLLVERWDGRGLRTATVRRNSSQSLRAMWVKLNEIAVDGMPSTAP